LYGKPVLVTEYGGNWDAGTPELLRMQTSTAPFACFVSGHAGSPMCWWWEWLDQSGHLGPFGAIRRFIAEEDLRGDAAQSVVLGVTSASGTLWGRAWMRPGRILGHVVDTLWGENGGTPATHAAATITIGQSIRPGQVTVAWWDADAGQERARQIVAHPGGALRLAAPAFAGHMAFKLWRNDAGAGDPASLPSAGGG
jgi:hypothetical protein